jgi:hypothetical protein
MKTLDEFYQLEDPKEYFEFFNVEYDANILDAKHTLIMRTFGKAIKKADEMDAKSQEERLKYYRFALISAYATFANPNAPSAADVWETHNRTLPCQSCASSCMQGGDDGYAQCG